MNAIDPEIAALRLIAEKLEALTDAQRARVITQLMIRFSVSRQQSEESQ